MARLRMEWTGLRTEWTGLPRWARWVLAVYLAGFADGTAAHVSALAQGGIHAYSALSQVPLQAFFTWRDAPPGFRRI